MFIVECDKVISSVTQFEPMTSGSKNIFVVQFKFSDEWSYLKRTAVFRKNKETPIEWLLDDTNRCMIPWEVLVEKDAEIEVGVYGMLDDKVVMPTTWSSLKDVLEGVLDGIEHTDPTPDVYQQLLAKLASIEANLGLGGGGEGPKDGEDGFSPTVEITDIEGGHRVTITDKDGPQSFDVMDGADGKDGLDGTDGTNGEDGYSPSISVEEIEGGHRITIKNKDDEESFDVMDGAKGETGDGSGGGIGDLASSFNENDFNVTDGEVSIKTPVKAILSKSQFNALSDEEKSRGFYIVSDPTNSGGSSGGSSGTPAPSTGYTFGHGLIVSLDNEVTVNAVNNFEGDNSLPMTAAGVLGTLGNIQALLATI